MGGSVSSFQELCSSLRANDPDVPIVNTDCFPYFDNECAEQLGLALKDNVHVRKIFLDISSLASSGPDTGVSLLASFLQTSRTLKTLLIKSTPGLALQDAGKVLSTFFDASIGSDSIQELTLVDTDLTIACADFRRFLTECRPNLRRLRLSCACSVDPSGKKDIVDAVAQNKTITGIELSHVSESIWSACMAGVAMNENLHSLNLDRLTSVYDYAPLSHAIETNTSIESLCVRYGTIPNMAAMASSLQRNNTIVELILLHCSITSRQVPHIARILKGCPTLKRLNLASNYIQTEGFALLANGLYRNQTLKLLDISDNAISGREASRILGDLLRRNRSLEQLDINDNSWSNRAGIRSFATALARNQALTSLNLSGCSLGSAALEILSRHGLRNNQHLECLSLNSNTIGDRGLQSLIEALQGSNLVRFLFLEHTGLSDVGGLLLASFLSNSRCQLKHLSVIGNSLGDDTVVAIAHALETNQELEALNMAETNFGKEGIEALCVALRTNKTLKSISFTFRDATCLFMWHETLRVNEGLVEVHALSYADTISPEVQSQLDFYAWRNQCRPLMKLSLSKSKVDAVWAPALCRLSRKSQYSTLYHVLRSILPGHSHGIHGRKRQAPDSDE